MDNERRRELSALVEELAELARKAPARLGERVASLGTREQAELALRLPAQQRIELLLHAPKPMRVVRSLPDFEFYLTVREVGPADALPLVSLGSAPQLQHLLDLESWRRDRFDGPRAGAWVALLTEAGEPTLRRFLRAADDEQLALLFQRWIRAEPIVPEDMHEKHGHGMTEAGDETGLVSPDGNYRFSPTIPEHGPAVQRIARLFFLDQPERFRRVLWASLYELPAELEEHALRWRQSRLEEHGFPPRDEALAVYSPPGGVRSHPRVPEPVDPDGLAAPLSPLALPDVSHRLGGALERLADDARDRMLHEFFALANHLIVADGHDMGEPAAHRAALEKAADTIGIALERRGTEGDRQIAETVTRVPLIELFREGYAAAVELQQRARRLVRQGQGWAGAHVEALTLLDTPIRERIEALLEPRPQYFEVGSEGRVRAHRTAGELAESRVALEIAEVLGRLLVERLGLDTARVLEQEIAVRAEPPRFSTFVLTLMAWHATRGELRGDPLPGDVLADFLRNVASRRTAGPEAPANALERLVQRLQDRFSLPPLEAAVLGAFGRACLEQLASECGSLDPGVPVDPRFVSCLLIEA